MMNSAEIVHAYLTRLEQSSGKKLQSARELEMLFLLAMDHHELVAISDLAFTAKFLHNTQTVMKRIGPNSEGYQKLTGEFSTNLEKLIQQLTALISKGSPETCDYFNNQILGMTQENFLRLMNLIHDLSWVKNHEIDKGESPLSLQ